MAYNRTGYFKRAKAIQELTARHYEPGRQDRCLKWVWRVHIKPLFGICYQTFLTYQNTKIPEDTDITVTR